MNFNTRNNVILTISLCFNFLCIQSSIADDTTALDTAEIAAISVVAPDWEGFTSPNGEGLYWDILRAIFEPEGIKVKTYTAPWNRAMKMVTKYRTYMAIPGEYKDSEENLIFPNYPLEKEKLVTVTLKSAGHNLATLEALSGLKVTWKKGYDVLDVDETGITLDEFRDISEGLQKITSKKVDALIDEPDEVESGITNGAFNASDFTIIPFSENKYVYLGLHPGVISERLIEIYDRRTEALVKNGELIKIYKKWDADIPKIFQDM
jgi:polar amino acid transport system substrate-binding protein